MVLVHNIIFEIEFVDSMTGQPRETHSFLSKPESLSFMVVRLQCGPGPFDPPVLLRISVWARSSGPHTAAVHSHTSQSSPTAGAFTSFF